MAIVPSFKTLGTVLLKVVAFWVLLVAAYLALGRQFFPYIERYNTQMAEVLGDQLGAEVSIGRLTGHWQQFNPVLVAEDVTIGDSLSLRRVLLEPSVLQSVVTLSPVFRRFELDGFAADLEQHPEGWRLGGLPGSDPVPLDRLTALVRQQREVVFTEVSLHIQPLNLPSMSVVMDDGQMTGAGEDNWLLANARVLYDELEVPIELQLESTRVEGSHQVSLYARHGRLDFAPWLRSRWPLVAELTVSGEYWINLTGDAWQDMTVRLHSPQARLAGTESSLALNDLTTELYAERAANGFDVWVNHLGHRLSAADRPESPRSGPVKAKVSRRRAQWQVQWDQLPMAPVSAWLALNDASGFWRNAFPTGEVRQGKLTLNDGDWRSLRVTAEVGEARMDAYAGIPGLSGVSGQVRAEGRSARFSIDSRDVDFRLPTIYDDPFRFGAIRGALDMRWAPGVGAQLEGRHRASVAPSPAQAAAGEADLPISGHWRVDLPAGADAGREVNFRLGIEAPDSTLSWAQRLTPDQPLDPAVTDWINGNILAGDFRDVNFAFSSSFEGGRMTGNSLGLDARFSGARVRFDDNWPAIARGAGHLVIDNERLTVDAEQGELAGLSLRGGRLALPYSANRVDIEADVAGGADAVLELFQTGPLAMLLKGGLADWRASGDARGELSLSVPFDNTPPVVSVAGRLDDTDLDIPSLDLGFSGVSGDLNYNAERGLHAERLSGDLFGAPHRAVLRTDSEAGALAFELYLTGDTPLAGWGRWLGDPWLSRQDVRTPAEARLRFAGETTDVHIRSSLLNLPLDLPEPLAKAPDDAGELSLRLHFDARDWLTVRAEYDEHLGTHLELDDQLGLRRGTLAYGQEPKLRDEDGLFIDVTTPEADLDAWLVALRELADIYRPARNAGTSDVDWLREVSLAGETWHYLGVDWNEPDAQIQRNDEAWLINFAALETSGRVLIPHSAEPMFVDVSYLALPAADDDPADEDLSDPLRDLRPEDIPAMSIQIAQFSVGKRDFGSWRAEIDASNDELRVDSIVGDVPGARLSGTLVWRYLDNRHQSGFEGRVTTGNINTLLRSWDYAPVLVSENGRFDLDLDWNGSPANFDFKRLQGRIGLRLNDGSILELEEYEGVKLIGLLNFTRVLRRLALDFSDLIRDGITYDVIEGELLFDRGFARVGEQLVIDGPSMKFRFSGDADLIRDALDVDMVMTVPLSSTFPLVALLAGVSPQAAAAIYVTERVFNNELERLSSARMHVTGSLDEPELRFYRVFDNSGGAQAPGVGDRLRNVVPGGGN